MSKGKTGKGGTSASSGGFKWDQGIVSAQFEEENWKTSIVFVVENQVEDSVYLQVLQSAISGGSRRLFSGISQEELYKEVRELGNPKTRKGKTIPQFAEVCEPCKAHLENEEEIPLALLSKLLKFKLLAIKAIDIKRRTEHEKGNTKTGKKGKEKDKTKSGKKNEVKKAPVAALPKTGTKLRKRSEEAVEGKYNDDEPEDGPQHYIVITGFQKTELIINLHNIGVRVDCVIKFSHDKYRLPEKPVSPITEQLDTEVYTPPIKDEKALAAEQAVLEEKIKLIKERIKLKQDLKTFWEEIFPFLLKQPQLHHLAIQEYQMPSSLIPQNLSDLTIKNEFGAILFENIAVIMYNLLDARRQHQNYLENLKLIPVSASCDGQQVPEKISTPLILTEKCSVESTQQVAESDMRYYNDLMNNIPQESVSVALIMHCMLEQIVAVEEKKEFLTELSSHMREDGLHESVASHLTQTAFNLSLSNEEQSLLAESFDASPNKREQAKIPRLVHFYDDIAVRTHHLSTIYGLDPQEVEHKMLQFDPLCKMVKFLEIASPLVRERASHLHELFYFCVKGDITITDVDHALKQFVIESIELSTVTPDSATITKVSSQKPIGWDDPFDIVEKMYSKISEIFHSSSCTSESTSSCRRIGATDGQSQIKDESLDQSNVSGEEREKEMKSDHKANNTQGDKLKMQSSDCSKGILKSSSGSDSPDSKASSKLGKTQSIHFLDESAYPTTYGQKTPEQMLKELVAAEKRNLDEWCFTEHFKPQVFLQVLQQASVLLPFYEIYTDRQNQNCFIILYNPYSSKLQNLTEWREELHSNVGFRDYLDHVACLITPWLAEQEYKYIAENLSKEANLMEFEEKHSEAAEEKSRKRKENDKSAMSSSQTPSAISTEVWPESTFTRTGSLKEEKWKEAQTKTVDEEKEKAKKIHKSSKIQEDIPKNDKTLPSSKCSSKAGDRDSQKDRSVSSDLSLDEHWPFTGYDLGALLHISGDCRTLFPHDGGQIRIERTVFVLGSTYIKITALKDGHTFSVHLINPQDMNREDGLYEDKIELEELEKKYKESLKLEHSTGIPQENKTQDDGEGTPVKLASSVSASSKSFELKKPVFSEFGSVSAVLADGMILSFSQFGNTGCAELSEKRVLPPSPSQATSTPPPKEYASPRSRKGDRKKISLVCGPEKVEEDQKAEEQPPIPEQYFQNLYITCPDGLRVSYLLERAFGIRPLSEEDGRLIVKQSYLNKNRNIQPYETTKQVQASKEVSRIISSDGTVVKSMVDGSYQVLYADGSISKYVEIPQETVLLQPDDISDLHHIQKPLRTLSAKRSLTNNVLKLKSPQEKPKKRKWEITYPSGEKVALEMNGKRTDLPSLLVSMMSDPKTGQTMLNREDNVVTVSYPDGTIVVEHEDGTRITTYYQELKIASIEQENESGEDPVYKTRAIKIIQVECPGYATVKFNTDNSESLVLFGDGTMVDAFTDGFYRIIHNAGGKMELETDGTLTYYYENDSAFGEEKAEPILHYTFKHNSATVVETIDNEGVKFQVKHTGECEVDFGEKKNDCDSKLDGEGNENEKCFKSKSHIPRFFIAHVDGSGTELLNYHDMAMYLLKTEIDSKSILIQDSFPDLPDIHGILSLKPHAGHSSEKWFKDYEESSIIPPAMKNRNMTNFPPVEAKSSGPEFGSTLGLGLTIGSALKPPINPPLPKCPDVLEVRRFTQYKPVSPDLRKQLQQGMKNYLEHLVSQYKTADLLEIQDPRNEEEQILAANLQQKVQDILLPTRTVHETENIKQKYQDSLAPQTTQPAQVKVAAKYNAADWEKVKQEKKEEQEAIEALMHHRIPPYFQSDLGKAFLAEGKDYETMKHLADNPEKQGTIKKVQTKTDRSELSQSGTTAMIISQKLVQHPFPTSGESNKESGVYLDNPTPEHAIVECVFPQARPEISPVDRPYNHTQKQTSYGIIENVTLDTLRQSPSHSLHDLDPEYTMETSKLPGVRSLKVDVTGQPRSKPVVLPDALKGGRPGAQPNKMFKNVEDPVRRKLCTSLVAGASAYGQVQLARMRGLNLFPEKVNFGVLKEGCTYRFTVYLINTGVDSCHFKVKQPPPATGLHAIYKPGLIAAGLRAEFDLELFAIAVGVEDESGVGHIRHDLQITTETDVLVLPIEATHKYENRIGDSSQCGKTAATRFVSKVSTGSTGIIRPRKFDEFGGKRK